MSAPVGRAHHVVYDTADPHGLAAFYSALLGLPVSHTSDEFVVVSASTSTSGYAFALAADHRAPVWGDPARPQQVHLDVMVDDVSRAETRVLELGATPLEAEGSVWADPSGHPFCLIPRPGWAPAVNG